MSILVPDFLVSNINVIPTIMGAVILVFFSDYINSKLVIPIADRVRKRSHHEIKKFGKKQNIHQKDWYSKMGKYGSDGLATVVFILYCYFGAYFLAEYFFAPMLQNFKVFILPIVIILFLILSAAINTKRIRSKFMGL